MKVRTQDEVCARTHLIIPKNNNVSTVSMLLQFKLYLNHSPPLADQWNLRINLTGRSFVHIRSIYQEDWFINWFAALLLHGNKIFVHQPLHLFQ